MARTDVAHLRRVLTISALCAAGWALAVALSGGFAFERFGFALSSRNPRNPALVAIICAALAIALPVRDRRAATRELARRWRRRTAAVATRRPAWLDAASAIAALGSFVQLSAWYAARPLWLDEEMLALNLRDRSLAALVGPLWLDQSAPFGWLALQRMVLETFGTGERALRAVPVLFGLATLACAVWVARRWMGRVASGTFVLLCAIGPWIAHYPLELKPYSSDVFWALLLPALAMWAAEGSTPHVQLRRARVWWVLAAVGHWFANGGLLVVPACAVLLLLRLWRAAQWRAVFEMCAGGVLLLMSFALHFMLSIQHTLASNPLRRYWSGGLPPEQSDVGERIAWVASALEPLAMNPAGADRAVLFWLVVIAGWLMAPAAARWVVGLVPLTAFTLGMLGVVPLLDRVALWIVPMLYLALGFAAGNAVRVLGERRVVSGALLASATALVCAEIAVNGWQGVESRWTRDRNHGLDDRGAVEWLLAQRQAGDVVVTTQMGLPAVWWYGHLSLDAPLVEASHAAPAECADRELRAPLAGHARALVYIGFPDAPAGFADLLIADLSRHGAVIADRRFAEASRAAVIALRGGAPEADTASGPAGCVALQPSRRW